MVKITFDNLVIPESEDINEVNIECGLWLPVKEARSIARHLINMDAIFTYMYEDDEQVEIRAFSDDLDKILILNVEIKP